MVFKATFRWAKFWPFLSVPNIFSSRILQRRNKVKWKNKIKISAARPWSLFISHGFQNIFFLLFFFAFPLSNCWRSPDICQTGFEFSHRWRTPYCRLSAHGWGSCVLLRFVLAIIGILCCRIVCFSRWRRPRPYHTLFSHGLEASTSCFLYWNGFPLSHFVCTLILKPLAETFWIRNKELFFSLLYNGRNWCYHFRMNCWPSFPPPEILTRTQTLSVSPS